jgi:hypothetical protein
MAERVFEAIPVSYRGLFADDHLVDAQQFGRSLTGISKVSNSISHFLFFGEATTEAKKFQIRFYVVPSKQNGLLQEIVAVMNIGTMPMFSPVLMKVAKTFIEITFDAVVKTILNRKSETEMALKTLDESLKRHDEFVNKVHDGQMTDKAWMQDMISHLANQNRAALREVPDPVGKSVRTMQIGEQSVGPIVDEPTAEVLRAHTSMEVGDMAEYDVTVEGVFKTNGACRLRVLGDDRIVPGKITDPALDNPGNIYTTALNEGLPLHVTAKPTLKDGKVHTLFVSDARLGR